MKNFSSIFIELTQNKKYPKIRLAQAPLLMLSVSVRLCSIFSMLYGPNSTVDG